MAADHLGPGAATGSTSTAPGDQANCAASRSIAAGPEDRVARYARSNNLFTDFGRRRF